MKTFTRNYNTWKMFIAHVNSSTDIGPGPKKSLRNESYSTAKPTDLSGFESLMLRGLGAFGHNKSLPLKKLLYRLTRGR